MRRKKPFYPLEEAPSGFYPDHGATVISSPPVPSNSSPPFDTCVISGDRVFRETLERSLGAFHFIDRVFGFPDTKRAVASRRWKPDLSVIVIDPEGSGQFENVREFKERFAPAPLLGIVDLTKSDGVVMENAVAAGVDGILDSYPEGALLENIGAAIDTILSGDCWICSGALEMLRMHFGRKRAPDTVAEHLSNREREVLSLAAEGKRNAEIARELHVSLHTIKTHLKHIYERLCVRSRQEAIYRAGVRIGGRSFSE